MNLVRAAGPAFAIAWRASRVATAGAVALAVLASAVPAASAWLGKLLFDELAAGRDTGRIVLLAIGSAAGLAVTAAITAVASYCTALVRAKSAIEAEDRLVGAVGALPGLRRLEDPAFLDRVRLAEQGAQEAAPAVLGLTVDAVRTLIAVLGFGGAVVLVWPPMAGLLAASLAATAISQLTLSRLRTRETEAMMATQRQRFLFRSLCSDIRAAKEIRLFGLADLFRSRMVTAVRTATASECAMQRRIAVAGIAAAVVSAVVAGIALVVAATGAARGSLSIGDVTLFTAAVAGIQSPVSTLLNQLGRAGGSLGVFEHYLDVVTTGPDLVSGTAPVPPLTTGIELRDVWFRYDETGPWVLRGVDLVLPQGAAVGLVGVNGAGKSTLVKLLCRFYDPDRGRILWDGVDIRGYDPASLRARLGATFQDFTSYDLTAADNIGIGDVARLGDLDRIRAAARLAEIDPALSALPRGYETLLSRAFLDVDDKAGAALSGGQWQRVALARSLMRAEADLLILDEPSSGMDADAETRTHEALRAHRAGRTSVLISHRLSALRGADRIVVLGGGRVVEQGTHDELLTAGGEYARLFSLQAKGYAMVEA
ncbi:ABC transporter ATP-binding protein [Amycolatopsis plumensis]|uniref:ABC transporter ATP-binding protein n=1 Tax=Amycolatopsis plumensis TaxID=236508 RepID=UPI00362268FD